MGKEKEGENVRKGREKEDSRKKRGKEKERDWKGGYIGGGGECKSVNEAAFLMTLKRMCPNSKIYMRKTFDRCHIPTRYWKTQIL